MSLAVPSASASKLARARTRTSLRVPSATNINLIRRESPILRPENQQRTLSSKERRRLRRPRPRSPHSSWGLIKGASGNIGSKKSQSSVGKVETKQVVQKKKPRKPSYTYKIFKKFRVYMANIDGYQSSHQISPHNLCVALALNTIPIFVISIIWDLFAVFVFEVPHLSMLNHPGFMLTFHFICLPAAMYGYMMRVIMGYEETRMTRLTLISIVVHFILLGIRATMELLLEGFRSESKQRYEVY